MTLTLWRPRTGSSSLVRIYVQGLEGGKAYLEPAARGGARFVAGDERYKDFAFLQLAAFLLDRGVTASSPASLRWADLESLAAPPPPSVPSARAATPKPAVSHARAPATTSSYASRDVHRMAVASIPLDVDVLIRVDHREPPEIAAFLREHPRIRVEVASLEIADYIIEAPGQRTVLVERKSAADFEASVKSGRLFDQAQRIGQLLGHDCVGVALLEGEVQTGSLGMLPQAVTGAITCIGLIQGLIVLNALDLYHSAWSLVKLGHHVSGSLGYALPLHKGKPGELISSKAYILQSLPGVSGELANRLLDHFGSVRAVMNATEAQLLAVPGLGKTKVKQIVSVLG